MTKKKIDKVRVIGVGKHWVEILYYGKKYLVFAINKRDKLRVVRWKPIEDKKRNE